MTEETRVGQCLHMDTIIFHFPVSKHMMKIVICPQLSDKEVRTVSVYPGLGCSSACNSVLKYKLPAFVCAYIHTTEH